jgi:hypothetical protein
MVDAASIAKAARDKADGITIEQPTPQLQDTYPTFATNITAKTLPPSDIDGSFSPLSPNIAAAGQNAQFTHAIQTLLNINGTTANWEPQRTPSKTFWVLFANTLVGTLWTPAAGKRFRLMSLQLILSAGVTSAGNIALDLQDGGKNIGGVAGTIALSAVVIAAPGLALPLIIDLSKWLPFNGYLSTAPDQALTSAAGNDINFGYATFLLAGTEE